MAILKMNDIVKMKTDELKKKLRELRSELKIELSHAKRKVKMDNPKKIREIKKAIARILTELNKRKEYNEIKG